MSKFVDAIKCLAKEAGYKVSDDGQRLIIELDDKTPQIVEDIITHFNQTANTKFKSTSKETMIRIKTLLKAGYNVDQIKRTVEYMVNKWSGDATMDQYIRPSTLLRLSKFENYYAESIKGTPNNLFKLFEDDWQ